MPVIGDDSINRSRREHVLAVLSAGLHSIGAGGDPAPALAPELVGVASELAQATPHVDQDLEVRYALGMLHWLRYLALPPGQNQEDLQQAMEMLWPLEPILPEALPEPLRRVFAAGDAPHAGLCNLAI